MSVMSNEEGVKMSPIHTGTWVVQTLVSWRSHPKRGATHADFLDVNYQPLPSGKLSHNYGKAPFFMGKHTISTGPFSTAMLNYQPLSILGVQIKA